MFFILTFRPCFWMCFFFQKWQVRTCTKSNLFVLLYFTLSFPRCPFAGESIYSYLNNHLSLMANMHSAVDLLGSSLHVWPDFHGNRSPLADPSLKGMVRGPKSGPLCTSILLCAFIKRSRGHLCFLFCRWSDFLSPKPWMTWRCSIWPLCKLWLWVACFRP